MLVLEMKPLMGVTLIDRETGKIVAHLSRVPCREGKYRLGFDAPVSVSILRDKVLKDDDAKMLEEFLRK